MNFFRRLRKPHSQSESPKTLPDSISVIADVPKAVKEKSEYSEDSTFGWFDSDEADSSIFTRPYTEPDTIVEKPVLPELTQSSDSSPGTAPGNEGFDPYNTGAFVARKK